MNSELENAILESSVKDVDIDTENVEVDMDEAENMPNREKFDAKAIENEMLEIAQNRAQDPGETAAMVYHMYRPEFLKRLPKLSSRGKTRLIEMLVQYPLNANTVKFTSELEKELYFFADSMIQSKFVLMLDTYKDAATEMVKAQDEFIFNKEEAESLKEGA